MKSATLNLSCSKHGNGVTRQLSGKLVDEWAFAIETDEIPEFCVGEDGHEKSLSRKEGTQIINSFFRLLNHILVTKTSAT